MCTESKWCVEIELPPSLVWFRGKTVCSKLHFSPSYFHSNFKCWGDAIKVKFTCKLEGEKWNLPINLLIGLVSQFYEIIFMKFLPFELEVYGNVFSQWLTFFWCIIVVDFRWLGGCCMQKVVDLIILSEEGTNTKILMWRDTKYLQDFE